ncbi:MAG: hypothetical protein IK954_02505 [Clostridia bacterium]|nr:hypothetical protein [Clostridia bacterium]
MNEQHKREDAQLVLAALLTAVRRFGDGDRAMLLATDIECALSALSEEGTVSMPERITVHYPRTRSSLDFGNKAAQRNRAINTIRQMIHYAETEPVICQTPQITGRLVEIFNKVDEELQKSKPKYKQVVVVDENDDVLAVIGDDEIIERDGCRVVLS